MAVDWVSALVGAVAGGVTGAVAGAVASDFTSKWTDRRREREAAHFTENEFARIKAEMPDLIAEMKTDLSEQGQGHIREFFVLPHKGVALGRSSKPRFSYFEDEHDNLRGKLDILEDKGYLIDVTPGNTPIYRMTEEFVALARKYG